MRKRIMSIAVLLLSVCASAQELLLIDTLTVDERKILRDTYVERKKSFLAYVDDQVAKPERKKVKEIFADKYDNLLKRIDKNELTSDSPLNDYLNKLLTLIRAKNPELPNSIVLLLSREFQSNAASIGDGTIIVNNYLLSDLDSEDELAVIICHEIAHYSLKHPVNSVVDFVRKDNSDEMKKQTKKLKQQKYNKQSDAANLLKDIAYKNSEESRKKEIEADSLGFLYYVNLDRNRYQVVRTLEKLRDSDFEDDSLTVADYRSLFFDPQLHFSEAWFKIDNYDIYHYKESTKFNTDSLRTHPNVGERIAALQRTFPQFLETDDPSPITVSDTFTQWHDNAMLQNVYNEHLAEHYGNSLYEALKLYKREQTLFLKKMIGLNFRKLYEAQKNYRLNRYVSHVNIHKYTSSYNLFCTFINNLRLGDLETFANYFSTE
ncbi:MAG: M48 family metalloprotease [Bacteroidales bacterium]|nr:M48 family metalloprotease [Bacteroidales bacterium]